MQRPHGQVPLWWLLISILVVMNAAALIAVFSWVSFSAGSPGHPARYMYDGSVRAFRGVIRPPSLLGALEVWWPVVVSGGVSLLVLAAGLVPAVQRLVAKPVRLPRMTIFRVMVIVGLVAFWLWLSGTNTYWILRGIPVLLLTLVAGYRRGRLTEEIKAEPAAASRWMRLGVTGYSVALLLGVFWVVCVLVWKTGIDRTR
jgi:hypothetical protein